jgi:hypothetical protein
MAGALVVGLIAPTWERGTVAAAADAESDRRALRLLLAPDEDWNGARPQDVEAVLRSAGRALLRHAPQAAIPPLEIRPRGGPIVLFERTPTGAVRMHLNTGGNLWSQYAFQFGHELCHVLCRFDRDRTAHKWFEESLCETASLFVLRRMAEEWSHDPPYPNWRTYAPRLADYAEKRLAASPLHAGDSLAEWFRAHHDRLVSRPTDREQNLAVASALLPLFEARPSRWAAVEWLNAGGPQEPRPFREHLLDWRRHAPPAHAADIEAIAAAFGERLSP